MPATRRLKFPQPGQRLRKIGDRRVESRNPDTLRPPRETLLVITAKAMFISDAPARSVLSTSSSRNETHRQFCRLIYHLVLTEHSFCGNFASELAGFCQKLFQFGDAQKEMRGRKSKSSHQSSRSSLRREGLIDFTVRQQKSA